MGLVDFEERALGLTSSLGLDRVFARRLLRFLVIGVGSAAAYVATLNLLVVSAGLGVTPSAVIAFVAGGVVSYVGNTLWGFGAAVSPRTVSRFALVTLVTFAINTCLAWALELAGVHHLLISLVTVVVVATCNFIGHSLFTYRESGR